MKLNLEQIYLEMDTAIPLGIIVNEIVTNSLKYAFHPGKNGEINISLYRTENYDKLYKNYADSDFQYTLIVADNGSGIPKETNVENTNSLGLQLIYILIDQIGGYLELNRNHGTEFRISFNNK